MKILIVGQTGEGKTTIANLVAKYIELHGITCEVVDDETPEVVPKTIHNCLEAMVDKKVNITIETLQLARESCNCKRCKS